MPKYQVMWRKAYYATGVVKVEAEHEDDAYDKVSDDLIGGLGSSWSAQHDSDGDEVIVMRKI